MLHTAGNEGRTRLLRRDDAFGRRGILEAIHWKRAIRWIVDAIHVLKPIRFQSIRRNEVGHKAPPLPPAIDETRDLGFMLYDIDHAGDRSSLFFRARLDKGVMHVPALNSPEIHR